MKEIKNSEIELRPPKFVCDKNFSNIRRPLPQQASFNLYIIGVPGSGKSSLATNLICREYKKKYHFIYIIVPPRSLDSYSKNPFDCLDPSQIYNSFDLETLEEIYELIQQNAQDKLRSLLYIDDCAASLKDGGKPLQNLFLELAYNRRHLRLAMITTSQRILCLPRQLRAVLSGVIVFKPGNKAESKIIQDEFFCLDNDEWRQLRQFCYKTKHDFIYHPLNTNEYYRNFNKLEGVQREDF